MTPSYDEAGRLKELKVDNQIQMSEIVYNPMQQITQLKTGAATGNADIETFEYEQQTGLLSKQKVFKANNPTQEVLNLEYYYERNRGNSSGTLNGKTGQLTAIVDNKSRNRDRVYEYDALGRLTKAKAGIATGFQMPVTANWTQTYTYDRYGNRLSVAATGITQDNQTVPTDGLASLSFDQTSNRINGYTYDLAGNLIRGQDTGGAWQRYDYDTAGRMIQVNDDAGNAKMGNGYTSSGRRLVKNETNVGLFWYVWSGDSVLAEYQSGGWGTPLTWHKSYIYSGENSLLSTFSNNGSGGETLEFHHPDRLGTKLVTNNTANTSFEQASLPFGTVLAAESVGTNTTNKKFTTYDRSSVTGLDYAVNRTYSPAQGRFTQVDPIGMNASSLLNPQSFNLYAYCQNDPINHTDPDGLFLGSLFKWIGKKLWGFAKRVFHAAVRAAIQAAFVYVTSGFNFGAAVAAFVGTFVVNLGFPSMGNVLTGGWNPNASHPLNRGSGGGLNSSLVIRNFTSNQQFPAQLIIPFAGAITNFLSSITQNSQDDIDCSQQLLTYARVADKSQDANARVIPYIATEIQPQFQAALDEINEKIGHIGFTEMFRDFERQTYLYNKYKKRGHVASPGRSNHEAGYSFDIPSADYNRKTPRGETVISIFKKHGFIRNVPGDDVHFTWKGAPGGGKYREALNAKFNAYYLKCIKGQ